MDVVPGRVIGGKYELERLLGKGSMGEVWRARHTTLEDVYAVKLIDVTRVPDGAGRFQMEAHIAAKLSKKTRHIVSVTDHGEEGDLAYLVMPLLEGESLEHRIEQAAPLSLAEVSTIVTQVARALEKAHGDGFVHRDLKPANVFLTNDEDGRVVVKLLDFGIARSLTPVRTRSPFATAKDTVVGTPSYMSPEQTLALDAVDHRCDLWALAVVTYQALSRELPFEGETIQDVLINIGIGREVPMRDRRPDLPDAIHAFYEKAFADSIDDRFQDALDLAATFARAADVGMSERPSMAPPISMLPPATTAPPPRISPAPRVPSMPSEAGDSSIVLPLNRTPARTTWIAIALVVLALSTASAVTLFRTPNAPPAPAPAPSPSLALPPAPSLAPSPSPSPAPSLAPALSLSPAPAPSPSRALSLSLSLSPSPSPPPSPPPAPSVAPPPPPTPAPASAATVAPSASAPIPPSVIPPAASARSPDRSDVF
ncbi:MAG: Serine/threonine protein kinase [Labilithrix sp.]|nr:Serine/threonine protein kinase [Labilithrix sp.]